jgi:hypothetical protein
MPKKYAIVTLLIIFPLIVGLGCRFTNGQDPTATPSEEPLVIVEMTDEPTVVPTLMIETQAVQEVEPTPEPTKVPDGLVALENSHWIQDDSTVFVGYLFENPASDILYENVEFTIRLLGRDGNLIDSGHVFLPWFFPNETRGVVYTFWLADESVAVDSVAVDWTFEGKLSPEEFANPFTSDNVVYWDNDGFPIVTGRVVNQSGTTYREIRVDMVGYDSSGVIVGGGSTYIDFIHLNDYMGFHGYVDVFGDVTRVEVFPTLTISSLVVDKTDFYSEISVLDFYFYEDDFGYMMGGMVVQNETDAVLRNSMVYVTFYDADGNIATVGSIFVDMILPGETLGISPWISIVPEETSGRDLDILFLPGETDPGYELSSNPFRVNSATVTGDFNNYVRVNFTNTYSKQVSELDVYVLVYNAAGEIIGGGSAWTDGPTPPGGTSETDVWIGYGVGQSIDSIQAWVVPSYWTEFE